MTLFLTITAGITALTAATLATLIIVLRHRQQQMRREPARVRRRTHDRHR